MGYLMLLLYLILDRDTGPDQRHTIKLKDFLIGMSMVFIIFSIVALLTIHLTASYPPINPLN